MQPILVQTQLLDLPPAFKRPGTVFSAIYSSLAAGESIYTLASDGVASAQSMPTSLNGWLAVWGEILGLPKNPNESDFFYSIRIQKTLLAPVGTPYGIQVWSQFILGNPNVIVTENLAMGGYTITFPETLTATSVQNWLTNLNRIRPAGVPFNLLAQTNPLMIGTYSYIGAPGFAGSYLGFGVTAYPLDIDASTQNIQPLVSETLLSDPILNGKVQMGFAF